MFRPRIRVTDEVYSVTLPAPDLVALISTFPLHEDEEISFSNSSPFSVISIDRGHAEGILRFSKDMNLLLNRNAFPMIRWRR